MILVAGSTGFVGTEVCRLLSTRRKACRALVRASSDPDRVGTLQRLGAELATGDLKDRASLARACRGVDTVVSTASATRTRQSGDSVESVDSQGQLSLITAAADAGVRRFVFISFPPVDLDFPVQSAKRAAEGRLQRSGMAYTILQPTCFTEVWLSPAVGFDLPNGRVQIYGDGTNRVSWISFLDVAAFAVAALDTPDAANAVVPLGGPEALSPLEVVRIAEDVTGRKIDVQHVPEAALRAQFDAATDPMQKSFAALMLFYAWGSPIEMTETARRFGVGRLRSVREFLESQRVTAA